MELHTDVVGCPWLLLLLLLKCYFTSTEIVGLLRTEAQDVHLDFHTAPELSRNSLTALDFIACHKQLTAQNLTKPNNWANPIS